jgi:hypothetical protein
VGGDQIEYPGEKYTRTAGLTTSKILINSIISTKGERFLAIETKKSIETPPSEDSNTWALTYHRSFRRSARNIIY